MRLIYDLAGDGGKFNTRTDATPDPRTLSDLFLASGHWWLNQVHMLLLSFAFPSFLFLVRDWPHVSRGTKTALGATLLANRRHRRRPMMFFDCLFTIRDDSPTPLPLTENLHVAHFISTTQQTIGARLLPVVETIQ